MKYSFRNDYSEGAHPKVLQALTDTNALQTCGYGLDDFCTQAAAQIRALCAAPEAAVHFLVGGTQANLVVIDALLFSYEAVTPPTPAMSTSTRPAPSRPRATRSARPLPPTAS